MKTKMLRNIGLQGAYLGGFAPGRPLGAKKIVLIFNVKKIMLKFEHF